MPAANTDPHRPRLHFTPARGWMNDPNGMILQDGLYHLFFQHNPHGIDHAAMHWGHATSADLVTWQERSPALAPDALGACFSGTAVRTPQGVKLFYTAHQETEAGDHQTQCLVHCDEALTRFTRDPANPVLPNPGLGAFRDPKVLWHAPSRAWVMLVTQGQEIGFWRSTDLRSWQPASRFGAALGFHGGVWECPDLIEMGDRWVLLIGFQDGAPAGGSGTGYVVGGFDGHGFVAQTGLLWLDHGRDFYAAQSFAGTATILAWASNWDYARATPARGFRGAMSFPRDLALVDTPQGPRLRQTLPGAVLQRLKTAGPGTCTISPDFALKPGETAAIHLFGEDSPQFTLTRLGATATLRQRRPESVPRFGHDLTATLAWPAQGPLSLHLHIDRGMVELCTADGLFWATNLFFPANPEAPALIVTRQETQNG